MRWCLLLIGIAYLTGLGTAVLSEMDKRNNITVQIQANDLVSVEKTVETDPATISSPIMAWESVQKLEVTTVVERAGKILQATLTMTMTLSSREAHEAFDELLDDKFIQLLLQPFGIKDASVSMIRTLPDGIEIQAAGQYLGEENINFLTSKIVMSKKSLFAYLHQAGTFVRRIDDATRSLHLSFEPMLGVPLQQMSLTIILPPNSAVLHIESEIQPGLRENVRLIWNQAPRTVNLQYRLSAAPLAPTLQLAIVLLTSLFLVGVLIVAGVILSHQSTNTVGMLSVTHGQASRSHLPLNRAIMQIGRAPGNDLVIPDAQVSAQHARIVRQRDVCVLVDLNSKNGTFVNNVRITQRVLQNGDRIRIGSTELLFHSTVARMRQR